jgi:hypothetical protein
MIYKFVLKAVDRWDHQVDSGFKFLPLGLCLKIGRRVSQNEANALRLIEKHTTVKAPRLINITIDHANEQAYLLMTTVPGVPAKDVWFKMTYEERHQIARDLGEWIAQYRRIPNDTKYLLCDTLGRPLLDHRTGNTPYGPFNSKADFLNQLTENDIDLRRRRPVSLLYEKEHEICFTPRRPAPVEHHDSTGPPVRPN